MKPFFLFFIMLALTVNAQEHNLDNGFIAEGYDVVAYFQGAAKKGNTAYVVNYKGVKYKFHTEENKATFEADPESYIPQYGGWCAYAMGKDGSKAGINPKRFEIRDGKLYLFYDAFFVNTLDKWLKEDPEKLKAQADKHWKVQ